MESLPLKDIEWIGVISFWPPGPGWIVVGGFLLLLVMYALYRRRKRPAPVAYVTPPAGATVYERACVLAENTRRYALLKDARSDVAGLRGKDWLKWLCAHDTSGFAWDEKAVWLCDVGYAPEQHITIPEREVEAAEKAFKRMVKAV